MNTQPTNGKKQMLIFLGIAYALPFALGILMWIGYNRGIDLSAFPSAQMFYPAAGVMLAALITRKSDSLLPKRFFIGFLIFTGLMVLCSIASLMFPELGLGLYCQYLIMISAIVSWILLLTEKKEKRIAYGLKGGRWKAAVLVIVLYLVLYFARTAISYIISGEVQTMMGILQDSTTWLSLVLLFVNYFLVFTAFFGEEYGWRYYLQPVLQKKMGMVGGIMVLGIVWGLWHLPINFFYYTSPSVGIISLVGQLITCVTLGVFYGWAYLMTDNIWTVVILHFVNNNLVPIITGTYSADVLQNQSIAWGDLLFSAVINVVLFMGVIFTKYYRDHNLRLPTMDERSERVQQMSQESQTENI